MTSDRRERRFAVSDESLLDLTIRPADDGGEPVDATLLDISQGGLRFRAPTRYANRDELPFALSAEGIYGCFRANATVRWAEPDGEHWVHGCSWTQQTLETEYLEELAAVGAVDRRGSTRRVVDLQAEARTELSPEFDDVQVVDVCDGGVSIVSQQLQAQVSDRIMLRLSDAGNAENYIRARVTWAKPLQNGALLGCTFLTREDHAQFFQGIAGEENAPSGGQPLGATTWSMVVAAVLTIAFVVAYLL